ncbi:serine/threonine protein kinase [Saccharothrix sp. MB29]|nr:serine/threonine protein kinase [Saccharothrix sp. MB29]
MGEVHRAHDTAHDRVVALKRLSPAYHDDEAFRARFRREAQIVARLREPHVIPIHAYGEIDGRLYLDMRLVEGSDLTELIAAGPLEADRAVRIVEQVASALDAAHADGLVHRDVKPSNVLVAPGDFVYLVDFGIARSASPTATHITASGEVVGTLDYMAPERFDGGGAVDARADVYALACLLFACLTGRRPFTADGTAAQIWAHVQEPPPRASDHNALLPAALDHVIARGMAKDPGARHETAGALAQAARAALTGPGTAPGPDLGAGLNRPPHTSGTPVHRPATGEPTWRPPRTCHNARPWARLLRATGEPGPDSAAPCSPGACRQARIGGRRRRRARAVSPPVVLAVVAPGHRHHDQAERRSAAASTTTPTVPRPGPRPPRAAPPRPAPPGPAPRPAPPRPSRPRAPRTRRCWPPSRPSTGATTRASPPRRKARASPPGSSAPRPTRSARTSTRPSAPSSSCSPHAPRRTRTSRPSSPAGASRATTRAAAAGRRSTRSTTPPTTAARRARSTASSSPATSTAARATCGGWTPRPP